LTQFSIDHGSDASVWLDAEGHIAYANDAACRTLYRSRGGLLSLTISDINPDFPSGAWEKEWKRVKSVGSGTFEARHITKFGKIFPVEVTAYYGEFGGKEYIFASARDITQRKEAERQNNLQLSALKAAANGIVITDERGQILWTNPAFTRLTGYDAAEVIGQTPRVLKSGMQDPGFYLKLWSTIHSGEVWHGEIVNRRKNGTLYTEDITITPVRNDAGCISHFIAIKQDVTERKRAETALWESEEQLSAILDNSTAIIYLKDAAGRYIRANRAFETLSGFKPGEATGKTDRELFPREVADVFRANDQRVLRENTSLEFEETNYHDGTLHTYLSVKFPLHDCEGAPYAIAGISTDITERKRAQGAIQERTVYLNTLFEISPLGIVVLNTDGCIQMSNTAFEKLFQYSRREIAGAKLDEFIVPPELRAEAEALTAECLGGAGARATARRRRKDATFVDVDIYGVPLVIDHELRGYLALYQDITERKRAEADMLKYAEDLEVSKAAQEKHAQELAHLVEELAQERDLLGTLMDNLPDYVYYKDRQGRFLRVNQATAKLLGVSDPREALGKTESDFSSTEEAKAWGSSERQIIETGQPLIGRITSTRPSDRQRRWLSTSKVPIRDAHGRVTGLVGIARDITEHMQAEEKIRQSEAKYRSLVVNIPDVIWTMDAEMRFAFISPNIERVSGFSLDEVYRCGAALFLENVHTEDVGPMSKAMQALFANGEPYDVECRVRRKSGEWIWVHDRAVATYEKDGVRYADGLLSDITPSKRAEESLRASEERYRELFENASDIVYTTGMDTRLTSLNRVGQQMLGYSPEEVGQLDLCQLVAAKHWHLIERSRQRLLAGNPDFTTEVEVSTKDGRPMMLEVKPRLIYKDGKPVGVQGVARDITGRDEAELELRHAQKLESVGRLAAGIAHEINTPIQFVGDNTRFLQDSFGDLQTLLTRYQDLRDAADAHVVTPEMLAEVHRAEEKADCAYLMEEIPKALTQTLDGVTRVATIVRAMKEFAHPEGKEMAATDLNRALLSTLTVARNELKYVADVETVLGDLPLVVCNIGDINQVFLNLLVNAAHAIGETVKGSGQKGRIRVCTASEGNTVLVTIADTGCGIPEANRRKVFDPFFTTKEVGRGTGQGLAIARSVVVDRHKGTLTFESEVGKGTTFYIRLPIDPGDWSKEVRAS
jgi:PAS domain S-box-containing protein